MHVSVHVSEFLKTKVLNLTSFQFDRLVVEFVLFVLVVNL